MNILTLLRLMNLIINFIAVYYSGKLFCDVLNSIPQDEGGKKVKFPFNVLIAAIFVSSILNVFIFTDIIFLGNVANYYFINLKNLVISLTILLSVAALEKLE